TVSADFITQASSRAAWRDDDNDAEGDGDAAGCGGRSTTRPRSNCSSATGVPPVAGPEDAVTVTERDGGIFVELSGPVAGSDGARLAAAQIVCTADAAQRIAAPDAEPRPVAVTARDGRRIGKTSAHCPAV
ncbi:hypothetical protein ABZ646_42040, partial [Streptomyces sp. NPDC007162]|uniref:hypothetical protein n=1 Tax=Streptomyces sp. NPDC007162 TaxID=3156917 RepID=UPI0033C30FD4